MSENSKELELKKQIEILGNEILKLKKENEYLKNLAYKDPLTKLYNRRGIDNKIQEQNNLSYAIAICDIDNFKTVNDTLGHEQGDIVLKKIADILNRNKRNDDLAVRYGGDEFIIFFKDCPLNIAFEKMIRIKEAVYEFGIKTNTLVSLSVGISYYNGDKKLSDQLKETDDALYKSKKEGKNRITIIDNPKKLIR